MPQIPVNLGDVQGFESLPVGSYFAELTKAVFKEAKTEGKFPQIMVTYTVADGDMLGRTQSEWLSLSPKAAWRLKKWFSKFGLGDIPSLDFDDDTEELNDPDLYGSKVIFQVSSDTSRTADGTRTELVTVEELGPGVPEVDDTGTVVPPMVQRGKPAPASKAAAAEIEGDDEDGTDTEPEPAPAPRRAAPAARPAPRSQVPARRTLR